MIAPTAADRLRSLADRYWAFQCHEQPLHAILAGETRSDPVLFREGPADHDRRARVARELADELDGIPTDGLSAQDLATRTLLAHELGRIGALHGVDAHLRPSMFPTGPAMLAAYFANATTVEDAATAQRYVDRLATIPRYLEDLRECLGAGAERGSRLPRLALARTADSLRAACAGPVGELPWGTPFRRSPAADRPGVRRQAERADALVRNELRPAFESFADLLEGPVADAGRDSLACADDFRGRELYRVLVRDFTTTDMSPEEVHELGLAEVERLKGEMEVLAEKAGYGGNLGGYRRFLADDRFVAPSKTALLDSLRALCKRVDRQIPAFFGRIPRITYGVEPIPAAAAAGLPPAYAQPNPADRSSSGVFWVTSLPERCPSTLHPALALHEAWPGHLMHIALIQESDDLPAFRRHGATRYPACIEGWAIYCEALGLEMGVYDTPHQRFGRLEMEMWRALRLVVDTGIHWLGWPKERAADAMAAHLTLPRATISAEVDRYVCWPGQALAYQVGNLELRRLRAHAEARLGGEFRLRGFHDAVLAAGAVSLPVLGDLVEWWIDGQRRGGDRNSED